MKAPYPFAFDTALLRDGLPGKSQSCTAPIAFFLVTGLPYLTSSFPFASFLLPPWNPLKRPITPLLIHGRQRAKKVCDSRLRPPLNGLSHLLRFSRGYCVVIEKKNIQLIAIARPKEITEFHDRRTKKKAFSLEARNVKYNIWSPAIFKFNYGAQFKSSGMISHLRRTKKFFSPHFAGIRTRVFLTAVP